METLLQLNHYQLAIGSKKILHDISFEVNRGEVTGVIGESGSGKSVTFLSLFGLIPNTLTAGEALFIPTQSPPGYHLLGKHVSFVFQEPLSALNPIMRCGKQLQECLPKPIRKNRETAKKAMFDLLKEVGLDEPERILKSFPHQLSGGQRQRLVIAMAVAPEPDIIVADEPTTALDPILQDTVLKLFNRIAKDKNVAVVLISHDLVSVGKFTQQMVVMKEGRTVEKGSTEEVMTFPNHAYTKALITCKPTWQKRDRLLLTVEDVLEGRTKAERRPLSKHSQEVILNITELGKTYANGHRALDRVNVNIKKGETLGIIGASGSGKSTLGKILVQLESPSDGVISSEMGSDRKERAAFIQFVFQDPYSSLNPGIRALEQVAEVVRLHQEPGRSKANDLAKDLLEKVGIDDSMCSKYPKEFSGGQRQRICIARALAVNPQVIVLDESVASLDVSIQSQIVNLLIELKHQFQLTYLFISHDIDVVMYFCDRVVVLKEGTIIEDSETHQLLISEEPYVKQLLSLAAVHAG